MNYREAWANGDIEAGTLVDRIEEQNEIIALYETTAENCDVLRARLAKYEDAEGNPIAWKASGADWCSSIHHNPDAKAWADFFVAVFPGQADKHDLMIGWFANAMMAMHDHLKAQQSGVVLLERFEMEPYQTVDKGSSNYKAGFNAAIKQIRESLNQQPVSAGDDALTCDYCGAETEDPWHGSGMMDGAESRHIHACDGCRHMLPSVSAGGVDERPTLGYSVHGNRYMIKATRGEIPNPPYDDRQIIELVDRAALTASAPNHSEQARHMVREGWQLVPVELLNIAALHLENSGYTETGKKIRQLLAKGEGVKP